MPAKRKVEIIYHSLASRKEKDEEFLDLPAYFERAGFESEADLLSIATSVFILEQYKEENIDEIRIPISPHSEIDHDALKHLIKDLILFLLEMDVKVNFLIQDYSREKEYSYQERTAYDYIVPFSGGMDSFAGILICKRKFNNVVAISAGHKNQGPIRSVLEDAYDKILAKYDIPWRLILVEDHPSDIMQSRGFLYLTIAGLFAHFFDGKYIVVTECGLTMHQPKFTSSDIITKTTDPYLMKLTKKILEIYKINIQFIVPFSDLTKSEIASITLEKDYIKETNSCLHSRWAKNKEFTHCGYCYGCVLRRLSNIVAGVDDANYGTFILTDEPGHPYLPIPGAKVKEESYDNLVQILNFAYNILDNKNRLLYYTKHRIEKYKKWDLFKRFALDVFSAIHLLKKGKVSGIVNQVYNEAIDNKIITELDLKERIKEVRAQKHKPDFNLRI